MKEEAPLELVDATPRERRDEKGGAIWWARIRPARGVKLEHGGLCQDPTHKLLIYGRVVQYKGQRRIRNSIYVCAVCKPQPAVAPGKRIYPKDGPRHEEPQIYPMTPEKLAAVLSGYRREAPWWPGPEPKLPANANVAQRAEYIRAHKDWERWSRQCWSARLSLATYHQRLAEGTDVPRYGDRVIPISEARGYEA